jgi:hypothetical protein
MPAKSRLPLLMLGQLTWPTMFYTAEIYPAWHFLGYVAFRVRSIQDHSDICSSELGHKM